MKSLLYATLILLLLAAQGCKKPGVRAREEAEQARRDSIERARDKKLEDLKNSAKDKKSNPLSAEKARDILLEGIEKYELLMKGGAGGYRLKDSSGIGTYIVLGGNFYTKEKIADYLRETYSDTTIDRIVSGMNITTMYGRRVMSEPVSFKLPDFRKAKFVSAFANGRNRQYNAEVMWEGKKIIFPIAYYDRGGGQWVLDMSAGEVATLIDMGKDGDKNAGKTDADIEAEIERLRRENDAMK